MPPERRRFRRINPFSAQERARQPFLPRTAMRYPGQRLRRPFVQGAGKPGRPVKSGKPSMARAMARSAGRRAVSSSAPFAQREWAKRSWSSVIIIGPIIDALLRWIFPKEPARQMKRLPLGSKARGLAQTGFERAKARMIARVEQEQRMQKAMARVSAMNRQGIQRQPARQMQKTGRIKKAA